MPVYAPAQEKWPLKPATVGMLELMRGPAGGGRLWLVTEDLPDAGSGYEHWLALNAHWLEARETGPALVTLYAFPPSGAAPSPATSTGKTFGGTMRLDGYTITPWPARPGETVLVTLYWTALRQPPANFRVSLRLADPSGAQVYQRDAEPAEGYVPTSRWAAGQQVVDRRGLVLPSPASPGAYAVSLVVYDAAGGQVQALEDGSQTLSFGLLVER